MNPSFYLFRIAPTQSKKENWTMKRNRFLTTTIFCLITHLLTKKENWTMKRNRFLTTTIFCLITLLLIGQFANAQTIIPLFDNNYPPPWSIMMVPNRTGNHINNINVDLLSLSTGRTLRELAFWEEPTLPEINGNQWTVGPLAASPGELVGPTSDIINSLANMDFSDDAWEFGNTNEILNDLGFADGDIDHHTVYARINIKNHHTENIAVALYVVVHGNTSAKFWINGSEVLNYVAATGNDSNNNADTITLLPGDNDLLFKSSHAVGEWNVLPFLLVSDDNLAAEIEPVAIQAGDGSVVVATKVGGNAVSINCPPTVARIPGPPKVKLIYAYPKGAAVRRNILTAMLKKMEAIAHFYAYYLKGRTFTYNKSITTIETFDTKPHWEGFFKNDSQFAGERLFKFAKDGYEKQHGVGSYTPDQDIYLVVIDHVELGDRIRGGARRNGLGGEAYVSGLDLPWPIIAHELGHTFGLQHQYHDDQYLMSHCGHIEDDFDLSAPFDLDYLIGKIFTDTILSKSDKNWLEVHPAFAKVVPSSTNKTTITVIGSTNNQVTVSSNNRVRVSIDDPDGLHQIQLLVPEINPAEVSAWSCQNAYEQGNSQSLKRARYSTISGSPKKKTINFDVSKLWGNNSTIKITFQVIDSSGDITPATDFGWTTLTKAAQAGPAPSIAEGQQALIPNETALLVNYPNPFNPETWIPYQLSKPTDVTLTIYDIQGREVRTLDLGHQRAGLYQSRARAAYWDGKNAQGESVASGVYFYTLTAGEFSATRKLLIRK